MIIKDKDYTVNNLFETDKTESGKGEEFELDITALRFWKLHFLKCGLALRLSERLKQESQKVEPESLSLEAFKVRCLLKDPSEFDFSS